HARHEHQRPHPGEAAGRRPGPDPRPGQEAAVRPGLTRGRHMKRFRSAACAVLLLGAAVPVAAHDYWLVPETFTPVAGKSVAVRLFVGEELLADEERPWQPDKTTKLELVTAAGTTNLHSKTRSDE